jgi:hypothetical protein
MRSPHSNIIVKNTNGLLILKPQTPLTSKIGTDGEGFLKCMRLKEGRRNLLQKTGRVMQTICQFIT